MKKIIYVVALLFAFSMTACEEGTNNDQGQGSLQEEDINTGMDESGNTGMDETGTTDEGIQMDEEEQGDETGTTNMEQ